MIEKGEPDLCVVWGLSCPLKLWVLQLGPDSSLIQLYKHQLFLISLREFLEMPGEFCSSLPDL